MKSPRATVPASFDTARVAKLHEALSLPTLDDAVSRLRTQQAPESHVSRLCELVALAQGNPDLLAIFLVGSYARGVGDRVSDLDLVAICASGCQSGVLQTLHEVLSRHDVLNQFTGRHLAGGAFWKYVYLDFSSVEFHVFEPSTSFRLKRPYVSIWDPVGLLPSFAVEGEPIRHQDFAAYEHGDEGLIWELVDCIKWLSRGQAALARAHLKKLVAQMESGAAP